MIQELASSVAKWLEHENTISSEKHELFTYAVYSLLFGLLPVFLVMVLGFAFGMMQEGFIMILPFMLVRKFSGGYHLNSSKLCIIFSTAVLALALTVTKIMINGGHTEILSLLVLASVVSLCAFSPIDNAARKLTEREKQLFHKITCVLATGFMALYLIMRRIMAVQSSVALGVGILIVAALQLPYILKEFFSRRRKK